MTLPRAAPACHDLPMSDTGVEFAVAAWREEGRWQVSALPAATAADYETLIASLRAYPGEGGVFAFLGLEGDCLVAVRAERGRQRLLVGDGVAILDWDLLDDLADAAGLDVDEDELEEFEPVGDLDMFADFGMTAEDVAMLCEDDDLLPEDLVRSIAKRLGFADQLRTALRTA